jgi:hypothetical protein
MTNNERVGLILHSHRREQLIAAPKFGVIAALNLEGSR